MCLSWLFGKKKELGKVVHYFDKIQVVVVDLKGSLKVGDKIRIKRGEDEFEEMVQSMQVNHQDVMAGISGEEVAIKISRPIKAGASVYKV